MLTAAELAAAPVRVKWDAKNWGGRMLACGHCGLRTPLLDLDGQPSHKACYEASIGGLA